MKLPWLANKLMPNKYNGKTTCRAATARKTVIQKRNPILKIVFPWWGTRRTTMAVIVIKTSAQKCNPMLQTGRPSSATTLNKQQ